MKTDNDQHATQNQWHVQLNLWHLSQNLWHVTKSLIRTAKFVALAEKSVASATISVHFLLPLFSTIPKLELVLEISSNFCFTDSGIGACLLHFLQVLPYELNQVIVTDIGYITRTRCCFIIQVLKQSK